MLNDKLTPLQYAVALNCPTAVEALTNLARYAENTPEHTLPAITIACIMGHVECFTVLINKLPQAQRGDGFDLRAHTQGYKMEDIIKAKWKSVDSKYILGADDSRTPAQIIMSANPDVPQSEIDALEMQSFIHADTLSMTSEQEMMPMGQQMASAAIATAARAAASTSAMLSTQPPSMHARTRQMALDHTRLVPQRIAPSPTPQ